LCCVGVRRSSLNNRDRLFYHYYYYHYHYWHPKSEAYQSLIRLCSNGFDGDGEESVVVIWLWIGEIALPTSVIGHNHRGSMYL
jgi:hypothetical protein